MHDELMLSIINTIIKNYFILLVMDDEFFVHVVYWRRSPLVSALVPQNSNIYLFPKR